MSIFNPVAHCAAAFLVGAMILGTGCTRESGSGSNANATEEQKTDTGNSGQSTDSAPDGGESTGQPQDPSPDGDDGSNKKSEDGNDDNPGPEEGSEKTEGADSGGNGSTDTSGSSQDPGQECENGSEISCQQREDGSEIDYPGGVPQGSCKAGKKTCRSGTWSECIGAVEPKEKDTCELGNDDNCNGRPTDHCSCSKGETQECGSDVGACTKGTLTCQEDGSWSEECVGEIKPTKEICDGKDDENCDGKPDSINCECINGEQRECGKSDVGACRFGKQVCEDGKWGKCKGEIGPKPEQCDGKGVDEDCNGTADIDDPRCDCNNRDIEACEVPGGRGDCRLGKKTCSAGRWSSCTARFRSTIEICGARRDKDDNTLGRRTGDEDCDGQIDESDHSNNFAPDDPLRQGQVYMLDADGDGYGAMRMNRPQSTVVRRYCNSRKHEVPTGWVVARSGRADSDCGDCPGTGSIVNPGYTGPARTDANACLQQVRWKNGVSGAYFDYNCSGRGELGGSRAIYKCVKIGGSCSATGYWNQRMPSCGERAGFYRPADCHLYDIGEEEEICGVGRLSPRETTAGCK